MLNNHKSQFLKSFFFKCYRMNFRLLNIVFCVDVGIGLGLVRTCGIRVEEKEEF